LISVKSIKRTNSGEKRDMVAETMIFSWCNVWLPWIYVVIS
jgi:hypothetical protein